MDSQSQMLEALIRGKLERLNLEERSRLHLQALLTGVPPEAGVRVAALQKLIAGLGRCHPDVDSEQIAAFAESPEVSPDENVHVNHLNMALLFVASSQPQHHEVSVEVVMAEAARELVVERTRLGLPAAVDAASKLFGEIFSSGALRALRWPEECALEMCLEVPGRGLMDATVRGLLRCHFEHHVGGLERVRSCWDHERQALIEVVWRVDPSRAPR